MKVSEIFFTFYQGVFCKKIIAETISVVEDCANFGRRRYNYIAFYPSSPYLIKLYVNIRYLERY